MSEWAAAVATFWILWLADGLVGGRRERLHLAAWRGSARRPRARVTQSRWFLAPPSPGGWALATEDSPLALAPEGMVNWPPGATGRPPPLPEQLAGARWEELAKIESRGGWIVVNGRRLAPEGAAMDARILRGLAERLRGRDAEARAAGIGDWQARRFSLTRARRRLRSALGRTRWLARYNTLQTIAWAALSVALLTGWFSPGGELRPHMPRREAAEIAARNTPWWALLAWLGAMHLLALSEAWRGHRRLFPGRGEERVSLLFAALQLPPQALRLRAALLRHLAREFAPLPLILAAGAADAARAAAADTLRDLEHPLRPAGLPVEAARRADAAAALLRPAVERALAEAGAAGLSGLARENLMAAPAQPAGGACAYCPRCGDTFARADGVCAQGVALRPLPRSG